MTSHTPRTFVLVASALALQLGLAGVAAAQGPSLQPRRSPTVSPYVDLLFQGAGGGDMSLNYYRLYRPHRDLNQLQRSYTRSVQRFDRALETQRRQTLLETERSSVTPTGRPAGFMTHGGYFNPPGAPR